jgi:nicotinamide-nucleotide amidase
VTGGAAGAGGSRPTAARDAGVHAEAPAPSSAELVDLARIALRDAAARGRTIATAESCTGGLVAHALTEVPGSSATFRGGVVAYANDAKSALLDVDPRLIEAHGAVSREVAEAMAAGARRRLGADLGVAVTGIAGPDGGTEAKPVGLAYVCVAGPDGSRIRRCQWPFDRSGNKRASAAVALRMLADEAAGRDRVHGADESSAT